MIIIFSACEYHSKDYIFSGNNEDISLSVLVTVISQDSNIYYGPAKEKKSDTIITGDSVYLLAKVYPSGFFHKDLNWIVDDSLAPSFKYEYRLHCNKPGFIYPILRVIDSFGDTINDTISLLVNTPPKVESLLIPKNYGSNIPSIGDSNLIYFNWDSKDRDGDSIYYQLKVYQDFIDSLVLDTIVEKSYFSYFSTFKSLEKYRWQIIAYDIYDISDTSEFQYFYTGDYNSQNSKIYAKVQRQDFENNHGLKVIASINSKDTLITYTDSNGVFEFSLDSGSNVIINIIDTIYPDFSSISDSFFIDHNEYKLLEDYILIDKVAPQTTALFSDSITSIPNVFTYKIKDMGSGLDTNKIHIYINNADYSHLLEKTSDSIYKLNIIAGLPDGRHRIKLITQDISKNIDTLDNTIWIETYEIQSLNDTNIIPGFLSVPIQSRFSTKPYLKYYWEYQSPSGQVTREEDALSIKTFLLSNFGQYKFSVAALRPNGLIDSLNFIVNVEDYLQDINLLEPDHKIDVYDSITFKWTSAVKDSQIPIYYRLEYFVGFDPVVVLADSLTDTTFTTASLPQTTINWRIISYDQYQNTRDSYVNIFTYKGVSP